MLEMFIRRVNNCIYFFACDVTLNDLDSLTCWEDVFNKNSVIFPAVAHSLRSCPTGAFLGTQSAPRPVQPR